MVKEADGLGWKKTKNPRIKKRGDIYWARFQLRGVHVAESLGTRSFELAQKLVEEIESCILLGVNWRKEAELFETAWPEFLENKAKGLKTKVARQTTLQQYIWIGEKWFMPFFKDKRLNEIDEPLWDEYISSARSATKGKSFANHKKYFGAFLKWCFKKGKKKEIPELYNPDVKLENEDDADTVGKAFSPSELKTFRDKSEMPFKLAIYMAQFMGMRRSEITQLKKDRIDLKSNFITLKAIDTKTGSKTKSGRRIPIHNEVMPLLKSQIEASMDSPYLFPNRADSGRPMDRGGFKKPWMALKNKYGIQGRFHDFRHTFITMALEQGLSPIVVAEIVGADIKVIQRVYLHLRGDHLVQDMSKFNILGAT